MLRTPLLWALGQPSLAALTRSILTGSKAVEIERISTSNSFYDQALELRYKLFFEDYDLPRGIEIDDLEAQSYHFAISDQESLVGYGRLTPLGSG